MPSLLPRRYRGGRSRESALSHFEHSDRRNVLRVIRNRLPADVVLHVGPGRTITII